MNTTPVYFMVKSRPIVLDGLDVIEILYVADTITEIRSIRILYEQATSADSGVIIRIGKIGDQDRFGTYTTESSKSFGDIANLQKPAFDLQHDEILTIECDGGKTGVGVVSVQIDMIFNLAF